MAKNLKFYLEKEFRQQYEKKKNFQLQRNLSKKESIPMISKIFRLDIAKEINLPVKNVGKEMFEYYRNVGIELKIISSLSF